MLELLPCSVTHNLFSLFGMQRVVILYNYFDEFLFRRIIIEHNDQVVSFRQRIKFSKSPYLTPIPSMWYVFIYHITMIQ